MLVLFVKVNSLSFLVSKHRELDWMLARRWRNREREYSIVCAFKAGLREGYRSTNWWLGLEPSQANNYHDHSNFLACFCRPRVCHT